MNSTLILNDFEKAIIATISYFDIFNYPLTLVEVNKWLYRYANSSYSELLKTLEGENLKGIIEARNGFYFMRGRQEIIKTRLWRYQIAEPKFRIALKTAGWLRYLAFIKSIAVCNNLGFNNSVSDGDIDFFIITRRGRLWWSRLVVTLWVALMGIRRHGNKVVNRICLSFYLADDHLDLSDVALQPTDTYLSYWISTLAPIYNRDSTYQNFLSGNVWLKNDLPNFYPTHSSYRRMVVDNRWAKFSKSIDEFILGGLVGDFLEKMSRLLQIKKISHYVGKLVREKNHQVVISSSILKLHTTDRRLYYQNIWRDKIKEFII